MSYHCVYKQYRCEQKWELSCSGVRKAPSVDFLPIVLCDFDMNCSTQHVRAIPYSNQPLVECPKDLATIGNVMIGKAPKTIPERTEAKSTWNKH